MNEDSTPLPTPRDANVYAAQVCVNNAAFAGASLGAELANDTEGLLHLLGEPLFDRLIEFQGFCADEGAAISAEIAAKLGEE